MPLVYRARKTAMLDAARRAGINPNPNAIALALGLSEATVRRAMNGAQPSASTVLALAEGLGVPVAEIFVVVDKPD